MCKMWEQVWRRLGDAMLMGYKQCQDSRSVCSTGVSNGRTVTFREGCSSFVLLIDLYFQAQSFAQLLREDPTT
jgi:hypothetical protein